ncbi:hypothetical protein PENANT_c035G01776 [Penicillium antarcticum]|uniref:Rhodanese domain-containing protein n=1 Tax=Penicillium antarcticum TaxID=416450 RepID=A0A1V6PU15_9EURO|nr:uncharacterized protein N7508_009914 [Penicillium antarcticum]KAJ5295093.1 hypothetical protein N7508_009914 [Penicillium antarcticum]OQD80524.1 hypothetical protein PENANT_c035G01776 [Penicillium antarcticum]
MDQISDTGSSYPLTLPNADIFAESMIKLGIHMEDILVVYDTYETGLYFSPRVAWTCLHFRHQRIHVLNNFPGYVDAGFPISTGKFSINSESVPQVKYPQPLPDPRKVISFTELRDLLTAKEKYQIIDVRIPDKFSQDGHMPTALNIPLASILSSDKLLLPATELKTMFTNAGVQENLPAVLTCNSGVTAAALDLALGVSGFRMERRLYDGSWMEWQDRVDADGLIVID